MTASVIASVVTEPPGSRALGPLAIAASSASSMRLPASAWPACSRRRQAAQIALEGFVMPCPVVSGAETWTGSKSEGKRSSGSSAVSDEVVGELLT